MSRTFNFNKIADGIVQNTKQCSEKNGPVCIALVDLYDSTHIGENQQYFSSRLVEHLAGSRK